MAPHKVYGIICCHSWYYCSHRIISSTTWCTNVLRTATVYCLLLSTVIKCFILRPSIIISTIRWESWWKGHITTVGASRKVRFIQCQLVTIVGTHVVFCVSKCKSFALNPSRYLYFLVCHSSLLVWLSKGLLTSIALSTKSRFIISSKFGFFSEIIFHFSSNCNINLLVNPKTACLVLYV